MKKFLNAGLFSLIFILLIGLEGNCAPRTVYVKTAPPVVRVEVKPARPYKNAIWISGRWRWNGKKYAWVGGHYVKPRTGNIWISGHWVKKRRGWVWVGGHWKKK